ncbi:AraC family transcriptional regulator [Photobacterium sagamiensis]|uniref:helix-turn-helix transcriptional regulator n=1 Tax=Photobacterium sagamiensis TaxID=2910241 RepID=UPI003D14D0A6
MPKTKTIKSFYRESLDFSALCSHRVLRAGHLVTDIDHRINRRSVVGHEFIYCINGAGWVDFRGKRHYIHKGQLVWLPVSETHFHCPDSKRPWEIYWFRVDGGKLNNIVDFLQVPQQPTFLIDDTDHVCQIFESIFEQMQSHTLLSDISCDKLISELLVMLLEIRSEPDKITQDPVKHRGLTSLIYAIHSHYSEDWDIARFAEYCQVGKSQVFRLFKSTFNQSPQKWLKNYRLTQARRMLVESEQSISEIAYQVGYKDPLHFSKDFRRTVGISPSLFRENERLEQNR